MAALRLPKTPGTPPKHQPEQPSKSLFRTPLRNTSETVPTETAETAAKHLKNKPQHDRNSRPFTDRNSETRPYRGGETVSPSRAPSLNHPRSRFSAFACGYARLRFALITNPAADHRTTSRPHPSTSHSTCQPDRITDSTSSRKPQNGAGWIELIIATSESNVDIERRSDRTRARAAPSLAARGRDSFAAIGPHPTAARASTPQRAPQRVCRPYPSFAITGSNGRKACNTAICAVSALPCLRCVCKSPCRAVPIDPPEGTSRARSTNNLRKLDEKARARTPARGLAGQIIARPLLLNEKEGGYPGKRNSIRYFIYSPTFAAAVSKIWAAPPRKVAQLHLQRSATPKGKFR
jgi:hypothetical protein